MYSPDTKIEELLEEHEGDRPSSQRRVGIQLCYPFEEKRLKKWNVDVLIQPKFDGERCRALLYNKNCVLLSSEGHIIESVPHINKALLDAGWDEVELDGELYAHGLSFEEIHSRVSRKVNLHSDYKAIQYHIFDIVSLEAQVTRLTKLSYMQNHDKDLIKIVPTYRSDNGDVQNIMLWLENFQKEGYEGIIIRHPLATYKRSRSTLIMKFKPRKKDSYKILGYEEERDIYGQPKGRLGALICISNDGGTFKVGSGFTAEQRQNYWNVKENLIGKVVVVKYQHLTPGRNVPRFPVFAEVKRGKDNAKS
jgi:DNA ligase-1